MKKSLRSLLMSIALFLLIQSNINAQGTWTTLTNAAPDQNSGVMILLTDGTVMCLTGTGPGGIGNTWNLLTPDKHGSYLNGTWTTLPVMEDTRLYCATQVLPDGNVYVAGGEYGTGGNTAEMYNTVTKTWAYINGVPSGWQQYDGNSELLYDGTVIQGFQISTSSISNDNMIFTEPTNTYNSAAQCFGSHDEASWVKLRDSSIMNVDMGTQNSERYIPQQGIWVTDANLPIALYDGALDEAGPGFLLPNGKLFFLGDVQYTATYTPSGNTTNGSWKQTAAMPSVSSTQLGCPDACAAMMPNGIILCDFSPAGTYNTPTYFYEYDYTTDKFTAVSVPGGGSSMNTQAYGTNMLDLPDGTVLFGDQGDNNYYQYTPKGSPLASGKPVINSIIEECPKFMITGKLFNGISEGAGYGDDWQCATNYPIVRLTNGTNVYYAKTTKWNRIGAVMTDSLMDTAYFTIPTMPAGTYSVVVVANGIPSSPHSLTLPCVTTGIEEAVATDNYITVYPNPGNGIFTIQSSVDSRQLTVEVYNMLGEKVYQQFNIQNPTFNINLKGSPAGVYLYHVLSEQGELLGKGKFVINK